MKNRQIVKLNESQLRKIVKESIKKMLTEESSINDQSRYQAYFANCVNGGHVSWEPLGETYSEALDRLEEDGYRFVREIDDDMCIYISSDDVYYIIDLEEDQDGGWGSYFVELNPDIINMNESTIDEGFVNNLAQGAKSFFGKGSAGANNQKNNNLRSQNGGLNLGKRFNAAKTNYQMTKEGGKINDVIQFLEDMVANKQLTPQTTIADLIGGSLNNNKYGRLHAMRDNRTSRASRAQNDIYR